MAEKKAGLVTRREFVGAAASAASLMIVPRRVLGGKGYVPPSDRVNVASIGWAGKGRQ